MTTEQLYLKVLSFINEKRSIKDLKEFDCFLEEGVEKNEIDTLLYDLYKGARIQGVWFYMNGYQITNKSTGLILNARGLQMLNELEKKLQVNNHIHNSGTIGNIGYNNGSISIHNQNEADHLIDKIITELKQSNIIDKDKLIKELQESNQSKNKQIIISTLGKILSVSSHMSSIGQFITALLQYFNS